MLSFDLVPNIHEFIFVMIWQAIWSETITSGCNFPQNGALPLDNKYVVALSLPCSDITAITAPNIIFTKWCKIALQ